MSNMFTDYDTLTDKSDCVLPSSIPVVPRSPFEEYNAEGQLVGYYWYYGDTVNLQFTIDGEISVLSNAIIFSVSGQQPTASTKAVIGQKAYNIVDLISWTCIAVNGTDAIWTEDATFTSSDIGTQNLYFNIESYLEGKIVTFRMYDFRKEEVYMTEVIGASTITITIDQELSNKLLRGNYSCSLVMYDEDLGTYLTILDSSNCKLLVK